jgi:hypothetical protein
MSIFLINYFIDLFYINQYTICRLLRYKEGFSLANGKTIEKSTTIRVRLSSYNNIKKLADSEHITIQDTIDKILEDYKRKIFFIELNESILKYKKEDPKGWDEDESDRKKMDMIQDTPEGNNEAW